MCKRLRTDSIYTLRQTTPNVMNKIRFWQKAEDAPPVERKCRKVVPNHLVPADTKVRWTTTHYTELFNCSIVKLNVFYRHVIIQITST